MAIDDADGSGAGQFSDADESAAASNEDGPHEPGESGVRVGEYTWAEFMEEYGHEGEVSTLYPHGADGPDDQLGLDTDEETVSTVPSGDDWESVTFDPEAYLGYHPDDLPDLITDVFAPNAKHLREIFLDYVDPETTPVVKDVYTWEHYKWEYYYEEDGSRPRDADGEIDRFDEEEALGFDPDEIERRLKAGDQAAMELDDLVEERTVNVREDFDEDEFFSTDDGHTTVANRYDLEKAVSTKKKRHFREVERYWVNKPYAFVIIFHSEKENEKKYYVVEPYLTEIETELQEFLSGKLRTAIKYSDEGIKEQREEEGKRGVIEEETRRLLKRYDLFEKASGGTDPGIVETLRGLLHDDEDEDEDGGQLEGIDVRPEPALLAEDSDILNEYQVEKLLYLLKRNFIGYERIDPIKHDINVEDISCDGYNSPVFVYHSGYEQIISNVFHGEEELDDFVVKLAQRSGKGISKRMPQVDATLPDGSRAQLTLGREVSDHGTNYTIRQFKDVPFTPVDLINWNTFSLEEMAFLWLAIENHKSLIFAGGTASGKTTSLNAVSLFIPSNTKIVSIEDTREVELPQRNWIASITRPSFSEDAQGDVDEFDLLEAALRQRPDYIVMGEIRGEEGRTLFQVMSTGHTTYTTFHADSVDEVLKRFTTDPINVSKTMFTALDLVSIQTQTRVQGSKVRRNKSLTEINHYEAENDEINVQDVYQWQAETDEFLKMGDSNTLEEIQFDRGWSREKLEDELFKRRIILAYLIKNGLNEYAQVAATVQAFINDSETILTLIANGQLEDSLEDLREMESVLIDVDEEKEELVPRPDATNETYNLATDILERAEESLFEEYRGKVPSGLGSALGGVQEAEDETITVDSAEPDEFDFEGDVDEEVDDEEWNLGDGTAEFTFGSEDAVGEESPSWLEEDDVDVEGTPGAGGDGSTEAKAAAGGEESAGADVSASVTDPSSDVESSDRPELEGSTDTESETAGRPELEGSVDADADAADRPGLEEAADAEPETADRPELEGSVDTEPETAGGPGLETSSDSAAETTESAPATDSDRASGTGLETEPDTDTGTDSADDGGQPPAPSTDEAMAEPDESGDAAAPGEPGTTADADPSGKLEPTEEPDDAAGSAGGSSGGVTVDEPEDPAEDGLGGLFDDVDSALEDVEEDATGPPPAERESAIDSSDFDAMFPDNDLESIFGSGPPGDRSSGSDGESEASDSSGPDDGAPDRGGAGSSEDRKPEDERELESGDDVASDEESASNADSESDAESGSMGEPTLGDESETDASFFDDDSGSIFSDDGDDVDDGGSLFDDREESPFREEDGESIFGDESGGIFDEESDPDETGREDE